MVDRIDQKDHHLYPPGFELTVGSVKRYAEYQWVAGHCEGLKVMDLGCNTGFGCEIVARKAAHVVGVDVSAEAIEIAKKEFANNSKLGFELVVEGDLPYDQGPFDAVIALNIIEHFPDAREMLAKIHKILKPGGKLILTTVNRKLRIFPWQKPWNLLHHKEYDANSLREELKPWFPHAELEGMSTEGIFFPDVVGNASSVKWRTGIKYPVVNFLRRVKRTVLFQPPLKPGNPQISEDRPVVPDTQKQVRSSKDQEDFYQLVSQVKVSKMDLNKTIKLMAVCTRD